VKGTDRPLHTILAAFVGSLVIPVYFLRLMADGRKLQRDLRYRSSLEAGIRPETPDGAYD
jgi:hypothetical protein